MKKLNFDLNNEDGGNIDFEAIHKKSLHDLSKRPDKPNIAISLGYDENPNPHTGEFEPKRFGTYRNISLVAGEEKSRKTFLVSMLEACAIGGKSDNYNEDIKGHDVYGKYVIAIDTEQDERDAHYRFDRIPSMVGGYYDKYIPIRMREVKRKDRFDYLKWLIKESEYAGNIGIISIDGIVDMVSDPNDFKECSVFVDELLELASIGNCHIICVLHLNPGGEKTRGHLGTIIQQKCETYVIVKNEGDFSSVKRKRGRGTAAWKPFTFRIDDKWLPYKSDDEIETESKQITIPK